jgi:uncharacterized protein (DUF1684 family)
MAIKILQICPVPSDLRVVWYNGDGGVDIYPPVCLALTEKGSAQEIVYMEMVNEEIQPLAVNSSDFMGFVTTDATDKIDELRDQAAERG